MTENTDGANALLNRTTSRGFKWDEIGKGTWVKGTIIEHGVEQCRKWDARESKWTDQPDFWDAGDPKMQIVVELQTDLHDDEDDDGKRTLRSGPYTTKGSASIIDATRVALAIAGAPGLEYGAQYAIRWASGEGKSGDPRRFDVVYRRPTLPVGHPAGVEEDPFAQPARPDANSLI